jgi:hypothetical protein
MIVTAVPFLCHWKYVRIAVLALLAGRAVRVSERVGLRWWARRTQQGPAVLGFESGGAARFMSRYPAAHELFARH